MLFKSIYLACTKTDCMAVAFDRCATTVLFNYSSWSPGSVDCELNSPILAWALYVCGKFCEYIFSLIASCNDFNKCCAASALLISVEYFYVWTLINKDRRLISHNISAVECLLQKMCAFASVNEGNTFQVRRSDAKLQQNLFNVNQQIYIFEQHFNWLTYS